jgi:hypothetical protein
LRNTLSRLATQLEVEVDLDLNAHANARAWHGDRKQRSAKQAKTLAAHERALAVADKKAQAQLSKVRPLPGRPRLRTEPELAYMRVHARCTLHFKGAG